DGCPWDRDQSADSLKHLFLEECYELVEAIEEGDVEKIAEELGDVLFHGASQIQIAEEQGDFSGADVFRQVIEKLVRRHPHVFGDAVVEDPEEAVPRWDQIKRQEMAGTDRSILDGVPKAMPAMGYAQAVQGRAARMGFDWDAYPGVLDKVVEELRELETAESDDAREMELGDLLFSMVNASRWMGIEAETALRRPTAGSTQGSRRLSAWPEAADSISSRCPSTRKKSCGRKPREAKSGEPFRGSSVSPASGS
ncbi:Nucleoside triphosphate pyrophosphohydrolase, partial [Geodia barretti]